LDIDDEDEDEYEVATETVNSTPATSNTTVQPPKEEQKLTQSSSFTNTTSTATTATSIVTSSSSPSIFQRKVEDTKPSVSFSTSVSSGSLAKSNNSQVAIEPVMEEVTTSKIVSEVEAKVSTEKKMAVINKKAKVLKSFEATSTDQLDIKQGEIVVVTGKYPSGWWEAQNQDGLIGIIPGNYVEIISESTSKEVHYL
jgi:hypothetical protein